MSCVRLKSFEKLRQIVSVGFEQVVQDLFRVLQRRSQRVDEQGLVGGAAVTRDGGLGGENLVGFDRRQQSKGKGRQRRGRLRYRYGMGLSAFARCAFSRVAYAGSDSHASSFRVVQFWLIEICIHLHACGNDPGDARGHVMKFYSLNCVPLC